MTTAYEWAFAHPELIPLYLAFILIGTAWVYWSSRKLFKWAVSITAGIDRGGPLPPDDLTNEIALFMGVLAVDLVIIGAYIHWVTS